MTKTVVRKFSSLMKKPLLDQLKKEASLNGQSVRYLLEQAVEHYLKVVLPSVRPVRVRPVLRVARTWPSASYCCC